MASGGVNIKMGVTGVAQFKQNINTAKQQIKTMNADLALIEKQFKASGDAETYMQQKTEVLKAKLEEQKTVLNQAEQALQKMKDNGVTAASAAFQEMQRQVIAAKGDLIDTENQLAGVETSADGASDGVSEMNAQLKNIGNGVNWQNVTSGINSVTKKLENAGKAAWNMGQKLIEATLSKGQWADDLATRAKVYGLSNDELQRMEKTARIIDTPVEAIINAQKKLKKGLGSADKGVMGAFAELFGEGYDVSAKGWEQAFWDAGQAIMKFTDEEEKEVYAQRLFGRSWNELIPLFEAGRKEYEETNASWNTISDEQLDSLTKMDDQYQKLTAAWEDFQTQMLTAFSGPLTEGMEAITGLFEELNSYLQTPEGKAMLEQMGKTVSSLISDLTNVDPAEVVGGLQSVINGITDALKWIDENKNTVVGAMEAILGGWALLKIGGGVAEIIKIVDAVKGLIPASTAASAGATAGASWAGAFASAAMKAAPFLAFLYTLLNPSDTATNDLDLLWDENGNPTAAGIAAGLGTQQEAEAAGYYYPEWRRKEDEAKIREKFNTEFTGDREDAEARNELRRQNARAMEELNSAADKMNEAAGDLTGNNETQRLSSSELLQTASELRGLGGEVESAIIRGMSGINIYIDGQMAGSALSPYVGVSMGSVIAEMFRP